MQFETKIVICVRNELAVWQKLNVASFLAGGIAGVNPEIMGLPYADADGKIYGALIRQPILVFGADPGELQRTLARAGERGVRPHIYTAGMFATGHDAANRAVVAAAKTDQLDLVGLGFIADRRIADKITKGLSLHG